MGQYWWLFVSFLCVLPCVFIVAMLTEEELSLLKKRELMLSTSMVAQAHFCWGTAVGILLCHIF